MVETTAIQVKVLILESLQAQNELAKFMRKVAQRYGHLLSEEEAMQGTELMKRVSSTINRLTQVIGDSDTLTISDASYDSKDSDDKRPPENATVYPRGGVHW